MNMNIQPGHIARHTPRNAGAQGREAAIVDVAQDLLLRDLQGKGLLDNLAIKGGTAIRKLYAGNEGRFSFDLDFSITDMDTNQESIAAAFVSAVEGLTSGPFTYGITERRGKWSVTFLSSFMAAATLQTKLDFSPSSWLPVVLREWCPLPIHKQYGDEPLPKIRTIRLEENIAEKIARLNRTTTARDMYDLCWVMQTPAIAQKLNKELIRRLGVLKIWVDTNGLRSGNTSWKPGHKGTTFDPKRWLRLRDAHDFDTQDIGALAVPVPSAKELSETVQICYGFLSDLDADEKTIAHSDERDRSLAIKLLQELPGSLLKGRSLY